MLANKSFWLGSCNTSWQKLIKKISNFFDRTVKNLDVKWSQVSHVKGSKIKWYWKRNSLDSSKNGTFKSISSKCLNKAQKICPSFWDIWAKEIAHKRTFPKNHIFFFRKKNPLLVKNYSLASVLPTVSKTFE